MNALKYFIIQFFLFFVIMLIGYYADIYISKPFTYIDFMAIIIGLPIFILTVTLSDHLKNRLMPIRLHYKIFLSAAALIIGIVSAVVLLGEMQFA